MELIWNSLDNPPSSIVFYLEMKVELEVGVHDIRSRFTLRVIEVAFYLSLLLDVTENSEKLILEKVLVSYFSRM